MSSNGKLTLESLEANKEKVEELSKYEYLANGNVIDAKRQMIAFYSENSVFSKEFKETTSIPITHIIPQHVEKGKGMRGPITAERRKCAAAFSIEPAISRVETRLLSTISRILSIELGGAVLAGLLAGATREAIF